MQHEQTLPPASWPTEPRHNAHNPNSTPQTGKSATFASGIDAAQQQAIATTTTTTTTTTGGGGKHEAILLDDDEYENDSELGDDLHIDEAGNVLVQDEFKAGRSLMGVDGHNNSSMAHILAGYGTDICEQLIAEFIKLELNTKQLSALTDKDLEQLGIRDASIRAQMVSEFAELPNQDYAPAKYANADERCAAAKESNELVLNNVYKHLNVLKTSLSVALLRLYVRPTENVLINDHTYASESVLRTLDEFNRSVVSMEKRLLDMQYGNVKPVVRPTNVSTRRRRRIYVALFSGACSIGAFFAMRYMHLLRR